MLRVCCSAFFVTHYNIDAKKGIELQKSNLSLINESAQSEAAPSSRQVQRAHLDFLDGLRGLAALYVVLFHAYETSGNGPYGGMHTNLPRQLVTSLGWLSCGHLAVVVFIALSGYCLMIPIAKTGALSGGFLGYIKRRGRRILPPYFAALLVASLLILFIPGLGHKQGVYWDDALPAFTSGSLWSHLFLFHNLTPWSARINYPLWTVATEWQIYFLLPLMLLPLLRKFGLFAMLFVAIIAGVSPHYMLHGRFDTASPQFIGVFALGATGALINFAPQYSHILKRFAWKKISYVSCTTLVLVTVLKPTLITNRSHLTDLVVGGIITSLLIYLSSIAVNEAGNHNNKILKIFQSPSIVRLGTFSYSLYLMHAPILAIAHLMIRSLSVGAITTLLLLLSVGGASSIIGSYFFYLMFERPFVSKPKAQKT